MKFSVSERELRADPFVGCEEVTKDIQERSWLERNGRATPTISSFYIRPEAETKKPPKKGTKKITGPLVWTEKTDAELICEVVKEEAPPKAHHKPGIDKSAWDKANIHYIDMDVETPKEAEEIDPKKIPY